MLFCGGDNIFIFDVRMNTEFNSIKTTNQVSADSKFPKHGTQFTLFRFFESLFSCLTFQVNDIHCHPEDCVILGCTDDRMVKVWDIDSRECISQSFPLDSQPQSVMFGHFGKAVIACTAQKLYTFNWEPFQVLSQHPWVASKQSKLMTLTGSENQLPSTSSTFDNLIDTLDIRIEGGIIMHLGISRNPNTNGNLTLRTVQLEVSFYIFFIWGKCRLEKLN